MFFLAKMVLTSLITRRLVHRDILDNAAGFHLIGMPQQALSMEAYQLHMAVSLSSLNTSSTSSKQASVSRFMDAVCCRLRLSETEKLIPREYYADTWQFRLDGE